MNWIRKQPRARRSSVKALCSAAVLAIFLAGCSGEKPSTLPAAASAAQANEKAIPTSTSAEPALAAGKQDTPAAAMPPEKKDDVKFVREDVHPTDFEDTKKPYIRRGVKLYSDGSLVSHGLYTTYYRSGQKFVEGKHVDGVKQGPWQMWYENGKLAKTENYVDGKLDGRWTQFDANGVRQDEVEYKAGHREGKQVTYYPDGKQIKLEEEYHNGKLHGVLTAWHPNGTKGTEAHYKDGEPEGLQQQWFDDGKPAKQATYVNGKLHGKAINWTPKGEKTEMDYANGKRLAK
jgi:antitoxin component YwqK of YwqJK toxin-antitoxin module